MQTNTTTRLHEKNIAREFRFRGFLSSSARLHCDSTGCDTARDAASCRSKGGVKKRSTTSFRRDPLAAIPVHRDTCLELHEIRSREHSRFEKARDANCRDQPWAKVLFERAAPLFSIPLMNFKRKKSSKIVILLLDG